MDHNGIKFVSDIFKDLTFISSGCRCEIQGEVSVVTEILVVIIVKPDD